MDINDRLNQLTATVRTAKMMPMSAFCLVNRAEVLDILEQLGEELPDNLDYAKALLAEREAVLAAGHEQAGRIVDSARRERERMIEQTEVLVAARERAGTVTTQAWAESTRLLADADDYVDRKLAEFEGLLERLNSQVNNGRLRLTARREADLARLHEAAPDMRWQAAGEDGGGLHPVAEPEALDPAFG